MLSFSVRLPGRPLLVGAAEMGSPVSIASTLLKSLNFEQARISMYDDDAALMAMASKKTFNS